MNTTYLTAMAAILATASSSWAQASKYTNFIRQVQYPTGLIHDMSVAPAGQDLSELAIDPGGARFQLLTPLPRLSTVDERPSTSG